MEEWKSGKVEKWKSGKVEKWKSGRVEEWKSGEESVPATWSFPTWQDAWRDMGRTTEEIAAEEAAREERGNAKAWGRGNVKEKARMRRRFRTWGKCDENTCAMKARLAPLAGYFLRSLKNEMMKPSWGIGGREEMSLSRLYAFSCGNGRGATEKSTRSRDFFRVVDWCLNTLKNAAAWGFSAAEAAIARKWLENTDKDAVMIFPAGTWQRMVIDYGLKIKESGAQQGYSQGGGNGCSDVSARVSFYESKKLLNDETAPAEAGFSPLAPTPLVGAGAGSAFRGIEKNCSKGDARLGELAGRAGTPVAAAECAENARVAKFTGTLPRRLWWLVWKWLPAFGRLHYGKNVAWSEAHFVAWFKSCLVAGKRCVDLFDLYEEKLMKWHGLAADWRVPGDKDLHPRGLFSELYKAAAALPAFTV